MKLASGVITAGGTLGILIPPSVMIIVYAAVAGQSVVKLYAAAMFPGFFLSFLYLVYIIGWAMINPKIAPTAAGGADPGAGAGLDAEVPGGLFAQHVRRALSRAGLAGDARRRSRRTRAAARPIGCCSTNFADGAGAVHHRRRHALAGLVVRRHPSSRRRAGGGRPEGVQQLGTPGLERGPDAPPSRGRRELSTSWFGVIALSAR